MLAPSYIIASFRGELVPMDRGVLAAIRLLPKHRKSIEELVMSSENFRTLCGDLAEAETTLQRWESSTLPAKDARCSEYRLLINELEAEIRQEIRERKLAPDF
jgi:hypothetical protein